MDVKKKILFIVPSLRAGGSERVILYLVNNLDRRKFNIKLALVKKEGQFLNLLNKDIELIDLNSKQVRYSILRIIRLIHREKPDVVFSTLGYLNLILAIIKKFFPKIKFIARESSIPSTQIKNEKYPLLFRFLYRTFYNNFDLIISQSNYMKEDLVKNFGVRNNKIKIIHNPVDIEKISKLSVSNEILFDKNYINIISVGMLRPEKGFDSLLKAFKLLKNEYRLYIIGDGKEKDNLVNLAKKLKIIDRVSFLGFQDNPYKYMAQADLMVLSSRYEGFPNVVLEANALGLPVVAFDCPGGTREIIKNGLNGFLVECGNIYKMRNSILMASDYNWNKERIKKYIKQNYSLNKIINVYEEIFYVL